MVVKERPIIFSAPMVRALLEGRKSMTRRIVKPQPKEWAANSNGSWPIEWVGEKAVPLSCPYGSPGDRLWVRETHWINEEEAIVEYREEGEMPEHMQGERWRPSIHMPRWASRITLEITGVRVERVQDITPADCECEGITGKTLASPVRGLPYEEYSNGDGIIYTEPRLAFRALWDSIHGDGAWERNEWVWVISFKVMP